MSSIEVTSSERPSLITHRKQLANSSYSLLLSITSSGLFPSQLETQLQFSYLRFLFILFCLLITGCFRLETEVVGGRGLICMRWRLEHLDLCLAHNVWLEYLTKDPCNLRKLLSLVSPQFFCICDTGNRFKVR